MPTESGGEVAALRLPKNLSASPTALAERLLAQLAAEVNIESKFKDVSVRREGTQIIIPAGMTYPEARLWISRQEEAEEKNVAISASIPCFPLDGVIALKRAMTEIYGFTAYADTPTFFGPKPPVMVQVKLSDGQYETAPIGRIQPPMYEGGFLNAHCTEMALSVSGEVKKKFEPQVKQVLDLTSRYLREQSIYRGRAFILDLAWMEGEDSMVSDRFNPVTHAPQFMDVSDVDENGLILNQETMFALTSNIFTLIEQSEACKQNGIPLKHGCILVGPYGTGKTLTARVTASKAVRNHWTFLYLKTPDRIAHTLKMAEMYAPAVVFTEDIDHVVGEDRDDDVNVILNTLDGVDTKDKPIITILTTNDVDSINAAFLRPGRMDTIVRFLEPDAEAALKFVQLYGRDDDGRSLIAPLTDGEKAEVGAALAGYVPAFIAEAVQKAKRLAIYECGTNIEGKVTGAHLVGAAGVLRSHKKLMEREDETSDNDRVAEAVRVVNNA